MLKNLMENLKNILLKKVKNIFKKIQFFRFDQNFVKKFSKETSDIIKMKIPQKNKMMGLIQLDNSSLFGTPSKLFKGKEIPKVSDSKSQKKKSDKKDEIFFKFNQNPKNYSHSKTQFEELSKPKPEESLLGKRPFSPAKPFFEDRVVKKISSSSYFLKNSPIRKIQNDQGFNKKKQGKERIPSRKGSPSRISKIISRSKIKREEIENNSSLLSTLNTNLDYKIKFEGGELPKIRKKVCRKLYEIFSKKYNLGKKEAKHLALNLEYRMNTTFNHEIDSKLYRRNFKVLLKYLEV